MTSKAVQDVESTGQPGPSRITLRGVTKRFHRVKSDTPVTPVDNVSLDVDASEMVVLLGPSGCGKTTLLRCVAGLEQPDEGEILIDGEVVFSKSKGIFVPPNKRNVNMIFQSYALWPHMTVFENVAYPLRSRRTAKRADITRAVQRALEMMDIAMLADQHPGTISGGQQQRVALARAVVSNPGIILFDEPLSNVDAKVREDLRIELVQRQREIGFAALYVTHDQDEALGIAHRIAVLDRGRLVQLATPQHVYELPATRYVAEFVGTANVWEGTVTECSVDQLTVRTSLGVIPIGADDVVNPLGEDLRVGASVAVVSRPESWSIRTDVASAGLSWSARAETVLFAGSQCHAVLRIGDTAVRIVTRPGEVAEGDPVTASIQPSALRAFVQ